MTRRSHLLLKSILILITYRIIDAGFYIPDLPPRKYIRDGDINLGAIFPVSSYSKTKPCGDGIRSTSILQFVEALVYAIDQINADPQILPNLTLGFVCLDDCLKETTTISQSLSFIPDPISCQKYSPNPGIVSTPQYEVVGVVGSLKSSNSIAAASLLGPVQIPQISYSSTSDELSNKELYPYFMRVVPPDEFQAEAIVSLISHYGWSYISIVYSEGSYGELGYKNIKRLTDSKGICIATASKVGEGTEADGYKNIANDLIAHINARVVVVFTGPTQAKGLFSALKELMVTSYFIFIGSDGWAKRINNLGEDYTVALGAFTVSFYSKEDPSYTEYFKTIRPETDVANPWFREFWEKHFKCSFSSSSCNVNDTLSESNGFSPIPTVTPVMDAVSTFALAIDTLIKLNCPEANSSSVKQCLTGPLLLEQLTKTNFMGRNGNIRFDANGNMLGQYMIDQLVPGSPYSQNRIATYNSLTKQLNISEIDVSFSHVRWYGEKHPDSVCSLPCGIGEFLIQKELVCCWECRACRSNEIVTDNGTNCMSCPAFQWPDTLTNLTTCSPITPVNIEWSEPLAIMMMTFSIISIVIAAAVLGFYIKHHEARCIKASSRELSFLMLGGVFVGYITVFFMVIKPETWNCKMNYFCFCISFTWIYGPLLTRTIRIYRIFESGKKSNVRPRFIGPKPQIIIAVLLLMVQVIISTLILNVSSPDAVLSMPISTLKYVELSCQIPLYGLVSFLTYNICLVILCSYFAFKTRKLPDNFNEARFISMCVYTTLVIWLAFIPTYFTAGREYLKTVSLSIALLLNGTVVVLFLFMPKIYATIYLIEDDNRKVASKLTKSFNLVTETSLGGTSGANFTKVKPLSPIKTQ